MSLIMNIFKKILEIVRKKHAEHRFKQLKSMGMQIGKNVYMPMSTWIDTPYCYLITIGDGTRFGPNCTILAHDATMASLLKVGKIGRVKIGELCSFGLGTLIMPGVEVGSRVISAAASVITHNIPSDSVIGGNPAKLIMSLDRFFAYHRGMIEKVPTFMPEPNIKFPLDEEQRKKVFDKLGNYSFGYVKIDW